MKEGLAEKGVMEEKYVGKDKKENRGLWRKGRKWILEEREEERR